MVAFGSVSADTDISLGGGSILLGYADGFPQQVFTQGSFVPITGIITPTFTTTSARRVEIAAFVALTKDASAGGVAIKATDPALGTSNYNRYSLVAAEVAALFTSRVTTIAAGSWQFRADVQCTATGGASMTATQMAWVKVIDLGPA